MGQPERSEDVMAVMYRIRTGFTGVAGSPWLSTMYFLESGGSAVQAALAVSTFWSAVDNFMKTTVAWSTEGDVTLVESSTGAPVGVTPIAPVTGAGADTADLLPIATQALVRWRTGIYVSGREIRGRTFIPGITEAHCASSGNLVPADQTTINTAASNLVGDASSSFVVFSRTNLLAAPVATGNTWSQFAVLRSRRD